MTKNIGSNIGRKDLELVLFSLEVLYQLHNSSCL